MNTQNERDYLIEILNTTLKKYFPCVPLYAVFKIADALFAKGVRVSVPQNK